MFMPHEGRVKRKVCYGQEDGCSAIGYIA